jgi:hypothetical protein
MESQMLLFLGYFQRAQLYKNRPNAKKSPNLKKPPNLITLAEFDVVKPFTAVTYDRSEIS